MQVVPKKGAAPPPNARRNAFFPQETVPQLQNSKQFRIMKIWFWPKDHKNKRLVAISSNIAKGTTLTNSFQTAEQLQSMTTA